jgi:hypothetical protein
MKILCLGDSHTKVFEFANQKQSEFQFNVSFVPGATAQGAVNPNSKTDALNIFKNTISTNIGSFDKILIMLGEVDCGFLIWVRSKKYNIDVGEQIDLSITNLCTFIQNILSSYNNVKSKDIIIAAATLPTISDSTDVKYLNGARSEVDVSQLKRTEKTLLYNKKLQEICLKNEYIYIDISKNILGTNGIVKPKYLNTSAFDHHLSNSNTYGLWMKELKSNLK